MQSGLSWFYGESLLVFKRGIFPSISFGEHVAEESMAPGRVWIKPSASIGQSSGQIQVLVSKGKQGLGLVGIEGGDFAVLFHRTLKILLSQVVDSHRLMRIRA